MTHCHECGSEVADNDIFCPFCGISLRPIEVAGDDDASLESTIMMTPSELSEMRQQAADSERDEPERLAVPTDENIEVDTVGELTDDEMDELRGTISNESTFDASEESSSIAGVSVDDVPVPQILQDAEFGTSEESTSEQPESTLGEELPAAEPESDGAPADELFRERIQNNQDKISKPLEELELVDSYSSQSMFDSVRIMEPKNSDPRPKPIAFDSNLSPVPPQRGAAVESPAVEEPKPQTTPNIGMTDTDGRKSAKLKPLTEGTVLNGRYEIVRKIGGGGMGAVYLASDNNLGGVLRAVKEMVQSYIEEAQQEKSINDFRRESTILSTLDHPSIPTIFDYFYDEKESRFYLVMKYISGGDLSARLRAAPEGRIDEKSVTEWAIQIADVLDYLHSQPSTIVYRDLKPSNIMIDGNSGRVMLIDFGIARSIGQKEEKGVTAVGTMGYAPPELFSGNVEPRSDIYSLGSTMFHLLTGADPQSNPLLIFDFQKNPRPRQINPQLSDQIERILMQAVEYNAEARFSSAAEIRKCLEDHLENLKRGNVTFGVKAIPSSIGLANQAVFCGFCGQKIVATDLFCAFCGAKQPIAQQGVHSEIYTPALPTAKLMIIGTNELDTPAFALEKRENLVGRRDPMSNIFPEVDLSKYDPQTKISRRHARIWREGNSFLVEDLGSSNGTILLSRASDAVRLAPHQPHGLTNGDKLQLGDTTLHFVIA